MIGGKEQSGGWWLCVIVKAWIKGALCAWGGIEDSGQDMT